MSNGSGGVQCHYDVLGCSQDADTSAIKKCHRKLVLKYHPDKNAGDEDAAEKFILVQRAYEVLTGKLCCLEKHTGLLVTMDVVEIGSVIRATC